MPSKNKVFFLRGFSVDLIKALRPVFRWKRGRLPLIKIKASLHCYCIPSRWQWWIMRWMILSDFPARNNLKDLKILLFSRGNMGGVAKKTQHVPPVGFWMLLPKRLRYDCRSHQRWAASCWQLPRTQQTSAGKTSPGATGLEQRWPLQGRVFGNICCWWMS